MVENIYFANDVGFSALKGSINGKSIYVPSIDAHEVPTDVTQRKDIHSSNMASYMNDYVKRHMHLMIQSPGVTDDHLYVGDRANRATGAQGYNVAEINGHKYSAPLTRILTLSTIAGTALQNYYCKNKHLPVHSMQVNAVMVASLPVSEGIKPGCIHRYANFYKNNGNNHVVTILNFADNNRPKDIKVNIKFKHVMIGLEGQVADYGLKYQSSKPLLMSLKGQLEANYPSVYKWDMKHHQIVNSLTKSQNILNVDIGEGTTDCVAIQNGTLDSHDSTSFTIGCKNYLVLAAKQLRDKMDYTKASPENIREVLRKEPQSLRDQQQKDDYVQAVNDNIKVVSREIANKFSLVLSSPGVSFDIIYIFGGGSIAMGEHQYFKDQMKTAVRSFNGGHDNIPLLFIPKEYAQDMNLYGLEFILQNAFK